ncbi:MAG: DUF2752 domain-containing protein [Acidimicrobiales bacterium]
MPSWDGLTRLGPALTLAGLCAASAFTPAGEDGGPVICPYRLITGGGWCPGCGASRAVRATTGLDLRAALTLNPWAVLLLAQTAVLTGWLAIRPDAARAWWRRNDVRLISLNVAIALTVWLARLLTGVIPPPF